MMSLAGKEKMLFVMYAAHRGSMVGLLAAFSSSKVAHCCSRSSVAVFTGSPSSALCPSVGEEI